MCSSFSELKLNATTIVPEFKMHINLQGYTEDLILDLFLV